MLGSYEIVWCNRTTIAIQIKKDGKIVVRCPKGMRRCDIEMFVNSKSDWIDKQVLKTKCGQSVPFSKDEIEQLRIQTMELVTERVEYYASIMNIKYNRITVRAQRTRWGSCSSKGNLNFNCLLALVPRDVLDYVVVHELCHLKEMNHSARFWSEVQQIIPSYEKCKDWLIDKGGALINRIE